MNIESVLFVVALIFGFAGGFLYCSFRVPKAMAKMSSQQMKSLAAKVARERASL